MTLQIVSKDEPVQIDTLLMMVYGEPGSGKSSLAFSAHDPLLLDFDGGAHRAFARKDYVPIKRWDDIDSMSEADLKPYQTLVIDTVGRALDVLTEQIIKENPKMRGPAGALSLQGYGALKARFASWVREVRSFGKDVIFVAHAVESRKNDQMIYRPDITGGSYAEIFKLTDAVAFLHFSSKTRTLEWDPSEEFTAKNPAQLESTEIPHLSQQPTFLGDEIDQIKDSISAMSEEAKAIQAQVEEMRTIIQDASTPEEMDELVEQANSLDDPAKSQVKSILNDRRLELGFEYDKSSGQFYDPSAAPAAQRGQEDEAAQEELV